MKSIGTARGKKIYFDNFGREEVNWLNVRHKRHYLIFGMVPLNDFFFLLLGSFALYCIVYNMYKSACGWTQWHTKLALYGIVNSMVIYTHITSPICRNFDFTKLKKGVTGFYSNIILLFSIKINLI